MTSDINGEYIMARRLPARFDLCVETTLPLMSRRKLALQIRQDMWRVLQNLRGFLPAVSVTRLGDGVSSGFDVVASIFDCAESHDELVNPIRVNRIAAKSSKGVNTCTKHG